MPEVSRLIKKCNDFGAGGVSVAIGELADGLVGLIWIRCRRNMQVLMELSLPFPNLRSVWQLLSIRKMSENLWDMRAEENLEAV